MSIYSYNGESRLVYGKEDVAEGARRCQESLKSYRSTGRRLTGRAPSS